MTRNRLAVSLCFLLLTSFALPLSAADKPNFVLIFIDDMGYGDIQPFGSQLNQTPNLNRMAEEGLKLTSFYAAPVCSASRAQLLTGCYAPRVGIPGVLFPKGSRGLHPDEHTIADYLREEGYATMCVGKWHLGDQVEFLPTRQGFDGYLGIPYSNDMARNSLDGRAVHPLVRDEKVARLLEYEDQRQVTREYTEEAVKFIQGSKGKPFFLYFPHTAMHVPLYPHQDFVGKSKNGTYGDWVQEVDWSVGQVLNTLRQQGLDENTLVIFTSDNGPWASRGKAGGISGPLRGSKGCTLEGGVREPTLVRWPGKIKPGSVSDGIAGTTDILPTFVSLAGGKLRDDVKIDGVDLSPLLLGKTAISPRDHWFYYQGTHLKAVRSGKWKLAVKPQSIGMGMKERPADLQGSRPRLYDLDREIGELTNVAAEYPDVVARLQKLILAMNADVGSGKPGPGARPAGTVENPVTLYATQDKKKKPDGKKKPGDKPDFQPIFDGKTLKGWTGNKDWFRVEEGAIIAGNQEKKIPNNEFLTSDKEYENFELRLKARLVGKGKNAGIQFRSQRIPDHHEMIGFQCDIGTMQNRSIWGSLYDESRRRKFLAHGDNDKISQVFKDGGWNEFVIRCEGPRIQIWLNGLKTVDYTETEKEIPTRGLIGLQIHSGQPAEASYKDIEIRTLD